MAPPTNILGNRSSLSKLTDIAAPDKENADDADG